VFLRIGWYVELVAAVGAGPIRRQLAVNAVRAGRKAGGAAS
jgi:hypothetical protein